MGSEQWVCLWGAVSTSPGVRMGEWAAKCQGGEGLLTRGWGGWLAASPWVWGVMWQWEVSSSRCVEVGGARALVSGML